MKLRSLIETACTLFPPFIGLVSWKYTIPSSALYHSLSVASIAGGIAELLTDNADEVELATYAGLTHDYYQKGDSVGLTVGSGEEILKRVLEERGVEKKIVDVIVNEATRYNVAENPGIWAGKHPVAGLSMWLADTIAGAPSALIVEQRIIERSSRLDEKLRKLLRSLNISVFSVLLPQVALRSGIYSEVVRTLSKISAVPILARDGLIVASNTEVPRIQIDINVFRVDAEQYDIIYESVKKRAPTLSRDTFDERMRRELFLRGSSNKIPLGKSARELLLNIDLANVSWEDKGSGCRCVFCGLPVVESIHPAVIGYLQYASSSMERWNTRAPAVGVNLNYLFRGDNWRDYGIVSCPLCVLDAYEVYCMMHGNNIKSADYFAVLYFPLPTHYEVARSLSAIAHRILSTATSRGDGESFVSLVEESYIDPEKYAEHVTEYTKSTDESILVDSTWALHFEVIPQIDGELETMATCLSSLARVILFTGVYPVKFSNKIDPLTERRLLSPAYPLYDLDPASKEVRDQTPLLVALLSIIDSLDAKLSARRGTKLTDDRTKLVMEYLRYPYLMHRDLLLKHSVGRTVLSTYLEFRENPVSLFKQARAPRPSRSPRSGTWG
ncbi:MAG: HD domain-containing protein [Fervidicoccaceae archaeon]